jgi:hypothetical protein
MKRMARESSSWPCWPPRTMSSKMDPAAMSV